MSILIGIVVAGAFYLGFRAGREVGIKEGSWESVLARATKANERHAGKEWIA